MSYLNISINKIHLIISKSFTSDNIQYIADKKAVQDNSIYLDFFVNLLHTNVINKLELKFLDFFI